MIPKPNGVIAPIILLLGQNSTQPLFGGISLQKEWFVKIREHQHGSRLDLVFQNSHCFLHLWWQLYWTHLYFFPKYIVEWPSDKSESLDEVPVMACQSAEHADLGEGLWHRELLHCVHVSVAAGSPFLFMH